MGMFFAAEANPMVACSIRGLCHASPFAASRRGNVRARLRTADLVGIDLQRVTKPALAVVSVDILAKTPGEGAEDAAAEAGARYRQYRWSVVFLPAERQDRRRPLQPQADAAGCYRQRAVFERIGEQLMQNE